MNFLDIASIVLVLSALFATINYKVFKLPTTIGVMLISLLVSSSLLAVKYIGNVDIGFIYSWVRQIDFSNTLVNGMLGALLFAGALNINFSELKSRLKIITVLATFGVLFSTVVVGYLTFYICQIMGIQISLLYCMAFGALISPTDPIAVLAILRKIGVSKWLELDVTGESLFNDGVGYVVFTLFLGLAMGEQSLSTSSVVLFFLQEALGGILFGLAISLISYLLIRSVNDYHIEILITIALVIAGYNLATIIHVSAPIAIVVAGIVTGNLSRQAMQFTSKKYLSIFWDVIDEVLNCILFVLLGIEVLGIAWNFQFIYLGFFAIIIVLFSRWLSVFIPVKLMQKSTFFSPRSIKILTWGGLRGGLSVAMALLIPSGQEKQIILIMTYACVIFAIFVQGTTIARVAGTRTVNDSGELLKSKTNETD